MGSPPGIWCGIPQVDLLLGPVVPGRIRLLDHDGWGLGASLLSRYAVWASARGRVVYVDGCNSADPLAIRQVATTMGVSWGRVGANIQVSRSFTLHQLTTVLRDRLGAYTGIDPQGLEESPPPAPEGPGRRGEGAMLLVVAGPLAMYGDVDVPASEAAALCCQGLAGVRAVVRAAGIGCVISHQQGGGSRRRQLERCLDRVVDDVLQLRRHRSHRHQGPMVRVRRRGSADSVVVASLRCGQRTLMHWTSTQGQSVVEEAPSLPKVQAEEPRKRGW